MPANRKSGVPTSGEVVFYGRATYGLDLSFGPQITPGCGDESLGLARGVADGLLASGDGQVTHCLVLWLIVLSQPLGEFGYGQIIRSLVPKCKFAFAIGNI